MTRPALLLLPLLALSLGTAPPLAAPSRAAEPLLLASGKTTLALSGLALELPKDKRKGHTYSLSSSFSLDKNFDGRDVIDEKVGDTLVSGTWVLVGYFTAGGCKAVVDSADLADAWSQEAPLHGHTWQVRGGVFEFKDSLGKVPTVVLCADRSSPTAGERKALLLYHFFVDKPVDTPQKALMSELARRPVIERVIKSWTSDKLDSTPQLARPHVRNRGEIAPTRAVELGTSGLRVTLPSDGQIWLPRPADPEAGVDWLDRMVPSLPELNLEVMLLDQPCNTIFDAIQTRRLAGASAIRNLPERWVAGPTLDVDGDPEYVTCREVGRHTLIVGLFVDRNAKSAQGDFKPITALLQALVDALPK